MGRITLNDIKHSVSARAPQGWLKRYVRWKRKREKNKLMQSADVHRELPLDNVFHCCIQKTASQWLKSIFEDERFYRYTGFLAMTYPEYLEALGRSPDQAGYRFPQRPPAKRLLTPLYPTYEEFQAMPKPERYRVFYVIRDPRDLVVSRYFSRGFSHVKTGSIAEHRKELAKLSTEDGLIYIIRKAQETGYWQRLRGWKDAQDPNLKLFRYEDLTQGNEAGLAELFRFLEIEMPEDQFQALQEAHSFEKISGGRKQGESFKYAHMRKGVAGDWVNYFTPKVEQTFFDITTDLVQALGYQS